MVRRGGFTLLELLLVLALVSLLSALVAPRAWQVLTAAQDRATVDELRHRIASLPTRAYLRSETLTLDASDAAWAMPQGWRLSLEPARIIYQRNGSTEGGQVRLWQADRQQAAWTIRSPSGELVADEDAP